MPRRATICDAPHAQWCLLRNISDVAAENVEPRKVGMFSTFRRIASKETNQKREKCKQMLYFV